MVRRAFAGLLTVVVALVASIAWAVAAPSASAAPTPVRAPDGACSTEERQLDNRG